MIRFLATLGLTTLALAAGTAAAETQPEAAPPALQWSPLWPKFRPWEYAGTAALGLGALYYETHREAPADPRWEGGILFDDAVRGWLRAGTPQGRARAQLISDRLWLGGSAYPFIIDLPVALFVHGRLDVAWQLAMMDLEAYAVSGFVNRLLEFEVGHARPSERDCLRDPGYDELCGTTANNASFPSGHTLGIATAAGFTCAHHRYLPLYGHPVADAAPCVLLTAATLGTGLTRIIGDRHWASETLVGAAFGFGVGYTLPWLLHYRYGAGRAPRAQILPWAGPGLAGAAVIGAL
jgi:membrane-associated phospholipid phosphatase